MVPAPFALLLTVAAADLAPVLDAHVPVGKEGSRVVGCKDAPLPPITGKPMVAGEVLAFDIQTFGVPLGHATLSVGRPLDDKTEQVLPVRVQAEIGGVMSILGTFTGEAGSLISSSTRRPQRLVSVFTQGSLFGKGEAREEAVFAGDTARAGGRFRYRKDNEDVYQTKVGLVSSGDMFDIVSVVYGLRGRSFEEGKRFCFLLYHRLDLYRVEGRVAGVEEIKVPFGTRRARKLEAAVSRAQAATIKKRPQPIRVDAWISADDEQLPMMVKSPQGMTSLDAVLTSVTSPK